LTTLPLDALRTELNNTPCRCLESGNTYLLPVIFNLAPDGCEEKVHGPGDLFPEKELPVLRTGSRWDSRPCLEAKCRFHLPVTEPRFLYLSACSLVTTLDYLSRYKLSTKYAVASKCSGKIFISEKYKVVQPFKTHSFQNGPLVQLYTSASDCKNVRNTSGSHILIALSILPSHY
jgi:hypothetical protein